MSKYTTGEIAKLCDVSVRTVQYYDSRKILIPSELSEGGRRLYSEDDLKKLRIICFLRDMGFSIDNIGKLLSEEAPEKVVSLLVEQQEQILSRELKEKQEKLGKLIEMKRAMKSVDDFSVKSLGDIANIMKNQSKRKRMLGMMIVIGAIMDIIEIGTIVYGIKTGVWTPFAVGLVVVICLAIGISVYYFRHTDYICPQCHEVFKPRFKEAFPAKHTPKTRRLTCPHCGYKGFCVEIYAESENSVKQSELPA